MIRYVYNSQSHPPAPYVHVVVRNSERTRETVNVPALIDTAADRTILPASLVDELSLVPVETITMKGFGGSLVQVPVFAAIVQVRDLAEHPLSVGAHSEEPWVLLGRDVLNHHRLLLDGPQLRLEIT
jgi:predicted aspartyl protease